MKKITLLIMVALMCGGALVHAEPMTELPDGLYSGSGFSVMSTSGEREPFEIQVTVLNNEVSIQKTTGKRQEGESLQFDFDDSGATSQVRLMGAENSVIGEGSCGTYQCHLTGEQDWFRFELTYTFVGETLFMSESVAANNGMFLFSQASLSR